IVLGDVYFDMGRTEDGIAMYEKVVEIDDTFFGNTYFQLAQMQMTVGDYEDAATNFRKFIQKKRINPKVKEKAERQLLDAEFGATAKKNPVPFEPTNLGDRINGPDFEYFPVLTADGGTLVFTR